MTHILPLYTQLLLDLLQMGILLIVLVVLAALLLESLR